MSAWLFAVVLFAAYDVPVPYGVEVYHAALETGERGLSPFALAALLMAENKGRRFDPSTVGRYGATAGTPSAERGLFQIAPTYWPRYCGISREQLFEARPNIRCAAKLVEKLQRRAGARRLPWRTSFDELASDADALERDRLNTPEGRHDWRTGYRCAPHAKTSPACLRSVARVHRMHRRLLRFWSWRASPALWLRVLSRAGPLVVGWARASWHLTGNRGSEHQY